MFQKNNNTILDFNNDTVTVELWSSYGFELIHNGKGSYNCIFRITSTSIENFPQLKADKNKLIRVPYDSRVSPIGFAENIENPNRICTLLNTVNSTPDLAHTVELKIEGKPRSFVVMPFVDNTISSEVNRLQTQADFLLKLYKTQNKILLDAYAAGNILWSNQSNKFIVVDVGFVYERNAQCTEALEWYIHESGDNSLQRQWRSLIYGENKDESDRLLAMLSRGLYYLDCYKHSDFFDSLKVRLQNLTIENILNLGRWQFFDLSETPGLLSGKIPKISMRLFQSPSKDKIFYRIVAPFTFMGSMSLLDVALSLSKASFAMHVNATILGFMLLHPITAVVIGVAILLLGGLALTHWAISLHYSDTEAQKEFKNNQNRLKNNQNWRLGKEKQITQPLMALCTNALSSGGAAEARAGEGYSQSA